MIVILCFILSKTRKGNRILLLLAHLPLFFQFSLFLFLNPLGELLKLSLKILLQFSNLLISLFALIQLLVVSFDERDQLVNVICRLHYVANSFLRVQFVLGQVRIENLPINHSLVD